MASPHHQVDVQVPVDVVWLEDCRAEAALVESPGSFELAAKRAKS
jgi:hypothetical protein